MYRKAATESSCRLKGRTPAPVVESSSVVWQLWRYCRCVQPRTAAALWGQHVDAKVCRRLPARSVYIQGSLQGLYNGDQSNCSRCNGVRLAWKTELLARFLPFESFRTCAATTIELQQKGLKDVYVGLGLWVLCLGWLLRHVVGGTLCITSTRVIRDALQHGFVDEPVCFFEAYNQTSTLLYCLRLTWPNHACFKFWAVIFQGISWASQRTLLAWRGKMLDVAIGCICTSSYRDLTELVASKNRSRWKDASSCVSCHRRNSIGQQQDISKQIRSGRRLPSLLFPRKRVLDLDLSHRNIHH